jgi:hypothetical protein
MQEMNTALECVFQIFPDSPIKTIRVENPLLRVTIAVESVFEDCARKVVWAGKQQNLMVRNPKLRRRTMDNIRQTMAKLKEEIALGKESCSFSPTCNGRPAVETSTNQEVNAPT